jgi:hypothetical protein
MKAMTAIDTFCRQVRERSAENRQAMDAVRALPGQMVSVLRQELDSRLAGGGSIRTRRRS